MSFPNPEYHMSSFVRSFLVLAFVIAASSATAFAQSQGASPTDAATPPGLAKGTHPLGSYGGSNFDQVNLFNGNVSMSFPLASSSGRRATPTG